MFSDFPSIFDVSAVPPEVLKLKEQRGTASVTDCEWCEPYDFHSS
jgi:hypothetical protein